MRYVQNAENPVYLNACAHFLHELQSQVDDLGLAAAKEAAIGAIQDPVTLFMQQRGMLTMPAIQALKSNSGTLLLI